MALPNDPVMLLSCINTALRDCYPSLSALCADMDISQQELCNRLAAIQYFYSEAQNRFC